MKLGGISRFFFKEDNLNRHMLEGLEFDTLSEIDRNMLEEPILELEIKETVW